MSARSRKIAVGAVALLVLGFLVYRSSGMIGLADSSGAKLLAAVRRANWFLLGISALTIYVCYVLRAVRWQLFQRNLGRSRLWPIFSMTVAGFSAVFLFGRAGEPVRPILLARKEKLPVADMFGIYALERLFDAAYAALIAAIALLLYQDRGGAGENAGRLATAARTSGTVLFVGVVAAVAFLVYLRVHGTALLERRLQGWLASAGAKKKAAEILLGFVRGIQTIRTGQDFALAIFYSTVHWALIFLVYFWTTHAFGGELGALSLGDCMLVMAFTLAGSAVQLPGVGGGSQVAAFLAYTAIFGVEKEPAMAAAIVLWLISFAVVCIVGVPLLVHQGMSLGKLKELAEHEKQELEPRPGSPGIADPRGTR